MEPPPQRRPSTESIDSHFEVKVNKFVVGEYNYYEVIGEVKNTDYRPYKFVQVKAVFRNAQGMAVGEDTVYACATDFILPGETKTFKFKDENKPDYKTVSCSVVSGRVAD